MFECCSLYSGSSGNSFFIQTENTKILVDAGVSCKKIENALDSLNVSLHEIDAIFVTHEHIDHTKSVGLISSKYNIPIYTNIETWNALISTNQKLENSTVKFFKNDTNMIFQDLNITPFSTPHDAANPCGFNIFKDKKKISIATDLGHVSSSVIKFLEDSSLLMLEANYDLNVLKYSHYPYALKQRISGPKGHLENNATGKTIAQLVKGGLENALLIHLSKENNFPDLAYKTVIEELQIEALPEKCLNLNVAPRDYPSKLFKVG